jgi:hypothetical protein
MADEPNLRIEALPNCRVRLSIGQSAPFEFDSKGAADVAAHILRAAQDSFKQSGKTIPDLTKNPTEWVVLLTSAWGLAPSRFPDHETLIAQFGDTVLALPVARNQLRQVGEAMVALSAESDHGVKESPGAIAT